MTRCACKGAELSCIIGNIFTELRPPCDMCGGEAVTIHGITPTGHEATITLTAAGFDFEGCAEDTALLQRIRKARCIYAGTREGTQRAVRIQCDCEGERPCKAYLHDHEQHGALPEKYRFTLVNRIQEKAVDIYEMTLEANELDLRQADEHRQRQRLQAKALTYCKELLFFIELSQEMGFISMKSCEYWSKLALEVKYMIAAWKKRDKARV